MVDQEVESKEDIKSEPAHWESCENDDCTGCVTPQKSLFGLIPSSTVKLSELVAAKKENIFTVSEIRKFYGQGIHPDDQRQGILGEDAGEGSESNA